MDSRDRRRMQMRRLAGAAAYMWRNRAGLMSDARYAASTIQNAWRRARSIYQARQRAVNNASSPGVLGNSTRIRPTERKRRVRKVPKRVKRFNKRVRKIVLNTNELQFIRKQAAFTDASGTDPRLRTYKVPSNQAVLFKLWNPSGTIGSDILWPQQKTAAADFTNIQEYQNHEFFSEGLSLKFLVTHNMLETTNGHDQWYVGYKIVNFAASKSHPDITTQTIANYYFNPLSGLSNTNNINAVDTSTGSYAESNPQCFVDKHPFLKDITAAAVPSTSNIQSWVDLNQEGRLAKGITVLRSGYLVVPDNPEFTKQATSGVKKHITHSVYLPIKRTFNVKKLSAGTPVPVYDRTYILIWAFNETLGYGSITNAPAVSISWTHRFRDP